MASQILKRLKGLTKSRTFARLSACLSPRRAFARLEARPLIRSTSIISHQATLPFTTVPGNPEMKGGLSDEIYESQNQTFWELRFSCHYEYIDGKQYLKSMTIHGLWKNKLVNGEKKADNNLDYMKNMKRAMELLRDLKTDRPDVFLKMKKFWKSINHTTDQEDFWCWEILKHGSLDDYSYWIKAMEIADSFFDDEGTCIFHKFMEEEGFIDGTYSCEDLRTKMSNRVGKEVLVTFNKKGSSIPYPDEFSIFMDGSYTTIDHPPYRIKTPTFILDGTHPSRRRGG